LPLLKTLSNLIKESLIHQIATENRKKGRNLACHLLKNCKKINDFWVNVKNNFWRIVSIKTYLSFAMRPRSCYAVSLLCLIFALFLVFSSLISSLHRWIVLFQRPRYVSISYSYPKLFITIKSIEELLTFSLEINKTALFFFQFPHDLSWRMYQQRAVPVGQFFSLLKIWFQSFKKLRRFIKTDL